MTNAQYTLTGDLWAMPVLAQTQDSPTLHIINATPDNATISWSPSTPGFVLQETRVRSLANGSNSARGATNPIVVPATLPSKFYRLFKL